MGYKRWWNTIKGWFGSKPTNCIKKPKSVDLVGEVIKCKKGERKFCFRKSRKCVCKKNREVDLQAAGKTNSGLIDLRKCKRGIFMCDSKGCFCKGGREVDLIRCKKGHRKVCSKKGGRCVCKKRRKVDLEAKVKPYCDKLPWYKRWWNTIKGWFGSKPTNCIKKPKRVELTFFNKYAEVFRAKGLPMETYKVPIAADLREKLPEFVDSKPLTEGIKFYNEFAKTKAVLLTQDKTDKAFLKYIENFIMTWAAVGEQDLDKLHEMYTVNQELLN